MRLLRAVLTFAAVEALVGPMAGNIAAQDTTSATPPIRVGGQMGTSSELYGVSGRDPRRPSQSARLTLRPTVTLWGRVRIPMNFMLTPENGSSIGLSGVSGRQRLNQFGIHPDWGWGRADVGSFSGSYTERTWSGVRVDGAGVDVHPGVLQVGLFGGRARQAIFGGVQSGSFSRSMLGGRLGIGKTPRGTDGGGFLHLIFVRAWDDPSSLPSPADTVIAPPDSAILSPDSLLPPVLPDPFAVTPQENLVLGAAGGIGLLGGAVRWSAELDGSVHTRDVRASALAPEAVHDYPGILRNIVEPRVGTHADYAYSTELQVRIARLPGATRSSPRSATVSLAYRYVGPGYTSLGTASLFNDVKNVNLKAGVRFRRWSLHVDGMRQRDNLIDQKLATTVRRRLGGTLSLLVSRRWTATLRGAYATMGNDAAEAMQQLDYTTGMLATSQTFRLGRKGLLRSVALNYAYQGAGDANPLRATSHLRSHRADARVVLNVAANLSVAPMLGMASSVVGDEGRTTRATYGVSAQWRALDKRLATSASAARADLGRSNSLTLNVRSQYRLTSQDILTLAIRHNRYRFPSGAYPNFNERSVSLQWSRRF